MVTAPVRTAPRSPWQNAYVERVIGSIRRECLDHVIVFNAAGLRRVVAAPSRAWQGHAGPPPGHTAVSRWHRRHPRSRRTTPPLRSHRRVAVARRRSQTLPAVIPFVQHVRLALNDCPCRLFREQRYGTARTNTQVTGLEMECPGLVPTFDNHSLPSVVVRLFRCTRPSAHRQTGVLCFAP